jgi:hypothetical protein
MLPISIIIDHYIIRSIRLENIKVDMELLMKFFLKGIQMEI